MAEKRDKDYYMDDVRVPETPQPGVSPEPWGKTHTIGTRTPRVDAYERISGAACYPSDIVLPGMLYGAIVRCPHPHARVKRVDVSKALSMPGVHAVLTGGDKGADITWRYSGETKSRLFNPHCRFEGDAVAAVAAETPHAAWDAVREVEVKYEVLPYVSDERNSLKDGAPLIHEGGNTVKTEEYSRGDMEKGFDEADVVLEESYRSECEMHTPLELHGCAARWDGDSLSIWESTQGVYAVQEKVAEALEMPLSKVRVIGHYMGGGFGSKLRAGKYTIIAALLARRTGRPVKMFLTREETFLAAGNRPPSTMRLKAGAKKDGTLTALEFEGLGTGGAYPAGGTAILDWLVRELYTCPNVRTKTTDVYINAGPSRPFRAPGHPQCSWALDQMMDSLAEAMGMDPVDFRLKNIPTYSQAREGNPPYTTTGLRECIERGAREFGWKEARKRLKGQTDHIRRGVGMAAGIWYVGGGKPPSTAVVKLFSDGSVNLNMGASDIGTGTKTIMAMVVAEELGVHLGAIRIEHADTGTTQFATPSGGSKTVPTEAPTVRAAAVEVKRQVLSMAAEELGVDASAIEFQPDGFVALRDGSRKTKATDLETLKKRGVVVGVGYRGPNPEGKTVNPFAAQFCEVEVNMKTGEVRVLRFLGTNESGRVMDPLTFESQLIGGVIMGIGFAMTEERHLDHQTTGKLCNKNWHDYKLPTALDAPGETVSVPIDMPDAEANISGAKGLGEPVTIPTGAVIANAIYHATGIRVKQTPANPLNLAALFSESGQRRV